MPLLRPVLLLATLSTAALAQPQPASTPAPAPAPSKADAPPAKTDAPAQPATPAPKEEPKKADAPAYPPTPPKNLYATVDFRGKKAPALEVEEWISAKPDTTGKTVLIDFWATWCGPCRQIIPEMEQWQQKFKDDLVVIGVTAESKKAIENFYDLRGEAIKYPIARDGKNRTNQQIGISGIPHVLVISSDGIVRYQGFPIAPDDPLTEAKLKQIIVADKAARAKSPAAPKPPTPAEAKPPEPQPKK